MNVGKMSQVKARASVTRQTLDVPYVMELVSADGKGRWCEHGMWRGVSQWGFRATYDEQAKPDCKP